MRIASYSTPEPPEAAKKDPELLEYIQELRRRVEVHDILLEALAEQLRKTQEAHNTLRRNTTQPHMEPPK